MPYKVASVSADGSKVEVECTGAIPGDLSESSNGNLLHRALDVNSSWNLEITDGVEGYHFHLIYTCKLEIVLQ